MMNLKIKGILAICAIALAAMTTACGEKNGTPAKNGTAPAAPGKVTGTPTLNIRYIDRDSVTANYKLALKFQEETAQTISRIEAEGQRRERAIQQFAQQCDQKMRNNGYLTQESMEADQRKLAQMQRDGENAIAAMQRQLQNETIQRQVTLNDSIENFIRDYNASRGYDAILFKDAGVYFNPAYDITDEVIEGLNSRYSKN